jgi:L-seryl-tRNA(Ser) seleniumtransferase
MNADKAEQVTWSRRDIFRVGSLATAAGVMGSIGVTGATPESEPPQSVAGPEIYTRIGVRPFINLTGTFTVNGGALTLPEVREATRRAAEYAVDLDELMEKVGARIAELIGCEAAIVTSGAAAALTHATAACLAGTDPELIQQLPNLTGLTDEVIIPRASRNVYDHAFRTLGVRMVEVDSSEAFKAALGPRTALVAVLGSGEADGGVRLEEMVSGAHKAGVPVLVDAAAEIPRRPDPYLSRGADLVAYSGGKSMRGPQCAGLLLGRTDLVWAAFMNGAPHHGFGRMMKVGKEEIIGMLAAVEVLMSRGMDEDFRRWTSWLEEISATVTQVPGVRTTLQKPAGVSPYPTMIIEWDSARVGITAGEVYEQLLGGEPRIMSHAAGDGYAFRVRPPAIRPGDHVLAGRRIAEVLSKAPRGVPKKPLAPPAADLSGRWGLDVVYSRGMARHRLLLITNGNRVEGSHIGRRLEGAVRGTVDGDRVRLRSSLPYEGTRLNFQFEGTVRGQQMEGEVDLGEYGKARWTARRLEPRDA